MKYVALDCETSGLFDFSQPADAEGQPRLACLAMILLDEDLAVERTVEHFVRPDGWTMCQQAAAINGLTTEVLTEKGVPIGEVLAAYVRVVDGGYVVVSYNAQYDTKVLRGELRRAGIDDRFAITPNICIMRAAQAAGARNANGRGFPKLADACAHFGVVPADAHTALGDARAAVEIFRKLHALGSCPEPDVRYAKTRPSQLQTGEL